MHMKRDLMIGTILATMAGVGLWTAKGRTMPAVDQKDMNDWSYSKVKDKMSNSQTAKETEEMAKKNHVMLMGGMSMGGEAVTMTGEFTGADCYLSSGEHGHEHAMCAKTCVSHGSPVVFIAQNGTVYLVLPPKDGAHIPETVLDDLGKPGVTVHAHEIESHGIKALSVDSVGS